MQYDAVVPVSPNHKEISLISIRSLQLFSDAKKIFIITSHLNFPYFKNKINNLESIYLIDEDLVIDALPLFKLKNLFINRIGTDKRASWYFQQFLKMSICYNKEIADYFLIFDCDTILLKHINFFDGSKILINPGNYRQHRPYFNAMELLLGFREQVKFSFISEHMMIKKSYMKSLINSIECNGNEWWIKNILDSINDKDINASGFSEFETYGNYITKKYKDAYKIRLLDTVRDGAKYYGSLPNQYNLFRLMTKNYSICSFEIWHKSSILKIFFYKDISKLHYSISKYFNLNKQKIDSADKIIDY